MSQSQPTSATSADAGSTVIVTCIQKSTAKKVVEDFFSFCGSITKLDLENDGDKTQKATVVFAKPGAASTAVMLHGSNLDGADIDVKLVGQDAASTAAAQHDDGHPTVTQEDKPRTAIIAEYLAHGYKISDDITKKAIEMDNKHGLSIKFKKYLNQVDRSLGERFEKKEPAASGSSSAAAATEKSDATAATETPSAREPSLARTVQERANAVLEKPEVKSKTDLVWAKLSEYYNAVTNHPKIQAFYSTTSKTVADVHEEAKRIAEEKKAGGAAGAAGTDLTGGPAKQMSVSWLILVLFLFSSLSFKVAEAHEHGQVPADAEVAGYKSDKSSYIQMHMASEHHIGAFNLASFFSLHDLDRNNILDRSEIEAIYGVHHSESKKHSPNHEVHDEKANRIVKGVLDRIDKNGDGVITKKEFLDAGPEGLPSFEEEFGKGALGHHYDEESEFFVHHEEIYHNTPETQTDSSYNHPEDIEHFAKHEKIEQEEEQRERKAEGLPSIEEDARLRKEAAARGERYVSPYDKQLSEAEQKKAQREHDEAQVGHAVHEAEAEQHVFKTPDGPHIVKEEPIKWQEPERKENGKVAHPAASGQPSESLPQGVADRLPGETDEGRRQRLAAAKEEASRRPAYGQGDRGFAFPKDDADRMRKGAPYKVS